MRSLTLKANFAWTLSGNVTYALCQWGIMVVLAKLGSPDMVGRFALGFAITAPIILFAGLGLRTVQATDVRRSYQFSDYLALRLTTTFAALLLIAGVVVIGGYSGETRWVILLIGLAKAFEAVSDIYYGLFQQHERMDKVAISMMIKGPLSLCALALAMWTTHKVWVGAAALACGWALTLMLYDIPNGREFLQQHQPQNTYQALWTNLAQLARQSFPLGITMMLISLNTNIPRYFLERYWGERELGFFAAIAYLMVAGTIVVSALGQSASPRLARYYAYGDRRKFAFLLLRLLGIGLALGVSGILLSLLAGREILTLLYRKEYAGLWKVLVWVMVSSTVGYMSSFLGYAMSAARCFAVQPAIFFAVVFVNGLACFALIPHYGSTGAAWALCIANTLQLLASLVVVIVALYRSPYRRSGGIFYGLERQRPFNSP